MLVPSELVDQIHSGLDLSNCTVSVCVFTTLEFYDCKYILLFPKDSTVSHASLLLYRILNTVEIQYINDLRSSS